MIETVTIFLGSLLVFLIQPMVGNTLLPIFGGTASVWSYCLASFQILLVGGYLYAHLMARRTRLSRSAVVVHFTLLVVCAGVVAISVRHFPIMALMSGLGATYILISANSTLVQTLAGGRYSLYAISNFGSLIGLLAYPLVIEPLLPLTFQWYLFCCLLGLYAILIFALGLKPSRIDIQTTGHNVLGKPSWLRYLGLSFASCFLINSISTHLGSDISPIPLLWCLLLTLYLISYIIGFNDRFARWVVYLQWGVLILLPVAAWHFGVTGFASYPMEMLIAGLVLFFGGFVIHAKLYLARPNPEFLTRYYLLIALGGAFGGSVCSFIMPQVSTIVAEYPIALGLVAWVILEGICPRPYLRYLPLGVAAFVAIGIVRGTNTEGSVLARYRNFYGQGTVTKRLIRVSKGSPYVAHEFRCNGTTHGLQVVEGDWFETTPTVYYGEHAGGLSIINHPNYMKKPMRVAILGMGMGTLASYGFNKKDFYRLYEINPDVARLASDDRYFQFLKKTQATVDIVIDDARKALERERDDGEEPYDVIIVDVFSGDSIPAHMATREAFELYLDRLNPNGVLSFHISNWHLDLRPLIKAAAEHFQLHCTALECCPTRYSFDSTWAFMSRELLPEYFYPGRHNRIDFDKVKSVRLMTDDHHTLLPYLVIPALLGSSDDTNGE